MDWIQKHYDRLALLLLAAALLGSSVFMFFGVQGFSGRFADILKEVVHHKKATTFETEALERAQRSLLTPASWAKRDASLFVSRKYVAKYDLVMEKHFLIDPFEAGSQPLHPPIPNSWFHEHGLAEILLDPDALEQDPDDDGFTNLDEYLAKTSPKDPNSRPCYTTKLRLMKFVRIPFRLKFEAYDDDGYFQINTVDVRQPTQFVKLGEVIAGTKFKAVKFEEKFVPDEGTGGVKNVSVLTVQHEESGLQVGLIYQQTINSPDQYADFAFLWKNSKPFRVKKDGEFFLKPEPDIKYKLIDIKENEAVIINVKTSEEIKIPRQ